MQIIQNYLTKNRCYSSPKIIQPKGLVLHSTGTSQPDATKYFSSFNTPTASKMVHFWVQADGKVYQTLPTNYKSWHCGSGRNGSFNGTHISTEMTEPSTIKYTGGANWVDLNPTITADHIANTYKYSVELFAYLCQQFNFNPLAPNVIETHYSSNKLGYASAHADPMHLWNKYGLTLDQFKKDIVNAMNGQKPEIIMSNSELPYTPEYTTNGNKNGYYATVNVAKGDSLNVRNKPNGDIIGKIGRNFVVYVVETSGNWAKLDTGRYVYKKYLVPMPNSSDIYPDRFIIQVNVNRLNIRSTPDSSVNNNIVGTIKKNEKYTIVGVKNNFGLLYSGAGWVALNLKFVTRV